MITLRVERKHGSDEFFRFYGDVVKIGRGSTCHLRIDDDSVSRDHAELRRRGDGLWQAVDLGSGMKVGGTTYNSTQVSAGEVIRVGNIRITVMAITEERVNDSVARDESWSATILDVVSSRARRLVADLVRWARAVERGER